MHFVDAVWFGSTRLGSVQDRRHDIPPLYAPEFDTRSTNSREPSSMTHHHDIIMMMSFDEIILPMYMVHHEDNTVRWILFMNLTY
ncbi:hypothetical protein Hanom_Chr09g00845951 [Helianthus anomalus]